jgi:predicted hotdog family 3-hydroxylacyl-ACP dehydratase
MLKGRAEIQALIPHSGDMCLLDGVMHYHLHRKQPSQP